eukprot:6748446-Prymnesium_polylepis.1
MLISELAARLGRWGGGRHLGGRLLIEPTQGSGGGCRARRREGGSGGSPDRACGGDAAGEGEGLV